MRLRLQTQLLLATVAISTALTGTSLLVVRHSVRSEVRRQITDATQASVADFVRIQQRQSAELQRSAAMLSELPTLKSLMTTDRPTIQDASTEYRDLSEADLLLLANPAGDVMAVHVDSPGMSYESAANLLSSSIERREDTALWQEGNELYRVVTRPIIAGAGAESHPLGLLVLGKRIDNSVARELGNFAGTDIVLAGGGAVFAATLPFDPKQLPMIDQQAPFPPTEVQLAGHHYTMASVDLAATTSAPIRCYLLLPLTDWDAFLNRLNKMILVLGIIAVLVGTALVLLISRAITSPLKSLVAAVGALANGNYDYSLQPRGSVEVARLGSAFNTMRLELLESQRKRLESERMAALGRAAGSISHDLRHHLAAVVANAEFLHTADLPFDRDDIYQEVQRASAQMTELIDSLVEIARERPMLSLSPADLSEIVLRAAEAVHSRPEFRDCVIEVDQREHSPGCFDSRKLERAFMNLLLNACEASTGHPGKITVNITASDTGFECHVTDNGVGIPEQIRDSLFEPFVSAGKPNGTGLGLAIARKIIEDHKGTIALESTSSLGTTFVIYLPRELPVEGLSPRVVEGASLDAR